MLHYNDVIMGAMASQITSLTIVCSNIYSGSDKRKHQSPASLAFVRGIHRWPVNSPHKRPVTRKMFPFDDVIMRNGWQHGWYNNMEIWAITVWIYACNCTPITDWNYYGLRLLSRFFTSNVTIYPVCVAIFHLNVRQSSMILQGEIVTAIWISNTS